MRLPPFGDPHFDLQQRGEVTISRNKLMKTSPRSDYLLQVRLKWYKKKEKNYVTNVTPKLNMKHQKHNNLPHQTCQKFRICWQEMALLKKAN